MLQNQLIRIGMDFDINKNRQISEKKLKIIPTHPYAYFRFFPYNDGMGDSSNSFVGWEKNDEIVDEVNGKAKPKDGGSIPLKNEDNKFKLNSPKILFKSPQIKARIEILFL